MTTPKQKYWHVFTNAATCAEDGFFMHIIVGDVTGGPDDVLTRDGTTAREHTIQWAGMGEAMATTLTYAATFGHDPDDQERDGLKPDDWEDVDEDEMEDEYEDE